jgi:nucleoside-diphosphate-sugar epimerase
MSKLITGGLGFIGSQLARKLVKMGEEVVIFDINSRSRLIEDIEDKVKIVQGDLGNSEQVLDIFRKYKINGIYHTAALLSASAEASPQAAYAVNANGTFHILEAARVFQVESVIFLSSISTYGPGVPDRVNDDTVQRPTTMYGVTKVLGERLGEYYQTKFGVNFRGVRFPSIIGPGRGKGGASAYSSLIIQEPAAGRPYTAFVDEEARIPLLYIEDAVQSMISLEQAREENLKRRVYNIEGFSPTAKRLADVVKSYIPLTQIRFSPDPEMMRIVRSWPKELDGSNACQDWGWQTQYDLDKAVKHFIREFQEKKSLYE